MMNNKNMVVSARVIFALPFVVFGLMHLMAAKQLAGFVPPVFPGDGAIWVYISGIMLIFGGVTLLINKWAYYGAAAIALVMVVLIITMHIPGIMTEVTRQMATANFLKDAALLGGALTYVVKYGRCKDCHKSTCDCGSGGCSCSIKK